MVIVRDIEVYSLCEHHLMPFYGRATSATSPRQGHRREQDRPHCRLLRGAFNQERLTAEIARAVTDAIGAEGVGVVMECRHLCMMMRGVEKQNSVMVTSSVLGSFHDDPATRAEFMALTQHRV